METDGKDGTHAAPALDPTLATAIRAAIEESTWPVPPVSDEPCIRLRDWFIVRRPDTGALHLAGRNISEGEGRMSSAITGFDPESRRAVTASGRVYVLVGPPGRDADGVWVADMWLRRRGLGGLKMEYVLTAAETATFVAGARE
ncbi:MAG: hypothetical protein HY084_07995 [Gemmatimonadetes bacterium]|nr:hypothetical protein [Gemmatimonadota bacterium]